MELELKHKYLFDENDREYGANYYLNEFGDGEILNLKLIVGPFKDKSLNESILSYVGSKLNIASSGLVEKGLFKKTTYF